MVTYVWVRLPDSAGRLARHNIASSARAPIGGVPIWVTPDVLKGGFAFGALLAGGRILDHEHAPSQRYGVEPTRLALNRHFLSEAGMAELQSWLNSGEYRVDVPEEAALLTVAWLKSQDAEIAVQRLLEEIAPQLGQLRFYPRPASTAPPASGKAHLQPLSETRLDLEAVRVRPAELKMRVALTSRPLYARIVALLLETVEDGWPCQSYPEGWNARAQKLVAQLPAELLGSGFRQLAPLFRLCVDSPLKLTGRQVGLIRQILDGYIAKRGRPGSAAHERLAAEQAAAVARPTRSELAQELLRRLADLPGDGGLPTLEPWTDNRCLGTILRRSLDADLEELVDKGIVSSPEMLAGIVPQLSAEVARTRFADPRLQRLVSATYRAFSRRRSLLLLFYQSQVRLAELPWVQALEPWVVEPLRRTRADSSSA